MDKITFASLLDTSDSDQANSDFLTIEDHPSIKAVTYDYHHAKIILRMNQSVNMVRLYNEKNVLKYQIPVQSDEISLCRDLLLTGITKIGINEDNAEHKNCIRINIKA